MKDRLTKKVENEERYIANNFKREKGERVLISCDKYNAKVYNKLGRLEDTFELIEKMSKCKVCYKFQDRVVCKDYTNCDILYNPKGDFIEVYTSEFENLFGIIGMVIATPVVAILKIIYVFLDEKFDFFGFIDKEE